jgi:L-threonylcarbamoyladenylate synthase
MNILLNSIESIEQYAKPPSYKKLQLLKALEKPTTIIYPNAKNIASNLKASDGSVAIRVILNKFCNKLSAYFGSPILSTSANLSVEQTPCSFYEIYLPIKSGTDCIAQHLQAENIINKPSLILLWKKND